MECTRQCEPQYERVRSLQRRHLGLPNFSRVSFTHRHENEATAPHPLPTQSPVPASFPASAATKLLHDVPINAYRLGPPERTGPSCLASTPRTNNPLLGYRGGLIVG